MIKKHTGRSWVSFRQIFALRRRVASLEDQILHMRLESEDLGERIEMLEQAEHLSDVIARGVACNCAWCTS